jgi:hypothetical protein
MTARRLESFWQLPLGTRFRYLDQKAPDVWVILDHHGATGCGLIAKWDYAAPLGWVGQGIFTLADTAEACRVMIVEVVEPLPELLAALQTAEELLGRMHMRGVARDLPGLAAQMHACLIDARLAIASATRAPL